MGCERFSPLTYNNTPDSPDYIAVSQMLPWLVNIVNFMIIAISAPSTGSGPALRKTLPEDRRDDQGIYDAPEWGPSSIQSTSSIETDIQWNQLPPEAAARPDIQSEDCLHITLTVSLQVLTRSGGSPCPTLAFIHGGAFSVGSGDRPYYDPLKLCTDALEAGKPIVFASMNHRLGALGFMHSPDVPDLLPANNGLYDQIRAFEWLRLFLRGFGGDSDRITAMGQSAGAASVSLHNCAPRDNPLYRRAIVLSGSSVVMVTMSPEQHRAEFLHQAEKLGIVVRNRSTESIAEDVVNLPVDKLRGLNMVGAPCSGTELISTQDWATMAHARREVPNSWLESQLVG
ncbi:Carboxylesterase-like protein 21 [Elsinoe fawcettii]|nr:Carboxylesterase-like protein 21 [Elsinoe fawcettii]